MLRTQKNNQKVVEWEKTKNRASARESVSLPAGSYRRGLMILMGDLPFRVAFGNFTQPSRKCQLFWNRLPASQNAI